MSVLIYNERSSIMLLYNTLTLLFKVYRVLNYMSLVHSFFPYVLLAPLDCYPSCSLSLLNLHLDAMIILVLIVLPITALMFFLSAMPCSEGTLHSAIQYPSLFLLLLLRGKQHLSLLTQPAVSTDSHLLGLDVSKRSG